MKYWKSAALIGLTTLQGFAMNANDWVVAATVRMVRVNSDGNQILFMINEQNKGNIAPDPQSNTYWFSIPLGNGNVSTNSPEGNADMSVLLMAKYSGQQVQFLTTSASSTQSPASTPKTYSFR